MSKIDLHIHSCFSDDGEFSPAEIMRQCREQNMELVAIADHNSVRGAALAMEEAEGVQVISGVELDCVCCGRNFHLLGYGFDIGRREFSEIEQDIIRQEKTAAEEKIRLFRNATGLPVSVSEILAAAPDGVVTGEMIAEYALSLEQAEQYEILKPYLPGGEKSDMPNVRFYWDFFSEGKAAYVPIRYMELRDAAALIHDAGGIAVLAHPGQNLGGDDTLLYGIIEEGIDGIEAFSSYHSQEASARYVKIAEENGLLVTCGSDFHGKHKPNIRLGGHGALWEDERIMEGIAARLGIWQNNDRNEREKNSKEGKTGL